MNLAFLSIYMKKTNIDDLIIAKWLAGIIRYL